ncbi:hypothetical protein D9M70_601810 [compost metagenome]
MEFIDPYNEEPSNQLVAFGPMIMIRDGSERAEITIRELNLNRAQLIERRGAKIKSIQDAYTAACRARHPRIKESAIEELKIETANDKEFSLIAREFLRHLGV